MANIICQSCGHENDPTRTFCQNCGIRLEVPVQPVEASSPAPVVAAPVVAKARVGSDKKSSSARTANGNTFFGLAVVGMVGVIATFVEIGLLAALTAALIQAWRTPDGVIPPLAADPVKAKKFSTEVHALVDNSYARQIVLNEAQMSDLNQYLATVVKLESSGGWLAEYVKFNRVFVKTGEGTFDAVMQETALKHAFYLDVRYKLVARNNGQAVEPVAAYIGRLPLHPLVARYVEGAMAPAWSAVQADIQLLSQASQITLTPTQVQMS
ncbi:MAG: zinc ribbon domain-containing protein, partial [Chthoniobacterales bacterium]